jgi:hypothetical protein
LKWYSICSAGLPTAISQSLLPNSTTRPVTMSPLGFSGAVLRCRIRITSCSTYSVFVEYSVFQPLTCVGGWMWYIVVVGPTKPSVPKTSSEYRAPSGLLNCTCRFWGTWPSFV